MNKKFFLLFCLFLVLLFTACSESVDPRDAFVGVYDFETTGSVDIYVSAVKLTTIPLNLNGTLTISKENTKDQVAIIWRNDTVHGTVAGEKMYVDNIHIDTTYHSLEAQLDIFPDPVQKDSTQLKCKSTVRARLQYSSYAGSGEGEVTIVATKQTEPTL